VALLGNPDASFPVHFILVTETVTRSVPVAESE